MCVVVADIDLDRATRIADEVGGPAVEMDVTSSASVRAGVAGAEREAGPIEVLVNNAGGDRFGVFVETEEEWWERAWQLNLRSTLLCTKAVLPSMLERGHGSIVNVSSEAGRVGTYGGAIYSAVKAGVLGFTKSIAREGARRGVRCNAVAPGPIETPMLGALADPVRRGMIDATVMGRAGSPDEVAGAIAFLASDDSTFITGQTLAVSGGVSMW